MDLYDNMGNKVNVTYVVLVPTTTLNEKEDSKRKINLKSRYEKDEENEIRSKIDIIQKNEKEGAKTNIEQREETGKRAK